mmetsp:Transcript_18840/g.58604  ORF Transcript_18840/g.58604 Transcript_18840/m.58604 type:complete len:306 (-) Transcript_18840:1090-2007(-)
MPPGTLPARATTRSPHAPASASSPVPILVLYHGRKQRRPQHALPPRALLLYRLPHHVRLLHERWRRGVPPVGHARAAGETCGGEKAQGHGAARSRGYGVSDALQPRASDALPRRLLGGVDVERGKCAHHPAAVGWRRGPVQSGVQPRQGPAQSGVQPRPGPAQSGVQPRPRWRHERAGGRRGRGRRLRVVAQSFPSRAGNQAPQGRRGDVLAPDCPLHAGRAGRVQRGVPRGRVSARRLGPRRRAGVLRRLDWRPPRAAPKQGRWTGVQVLSMDRPALVGCSLTHPVAVFGDLLAYLAHLLAGRH